MRVVVLRAKIEVQVTDFFLEVDAYARYVSAMRYTVMGGRGRRMAV